MTIEEHIIQRGHEFVALATRLVVERQRVHFWRGQSDAAWGLVPSIFRINDSLDRQYESNTCRQFRRQARVRYPACPTRFDYAGWLFLMQHYRAPTRLLDWSESPLVALFFAAIDSADSDGCVWALDALLLNAHYCGGDELLWGPSDKRVLPLFRGAFDDQSDEPGSTIAILPEHTDLRHVMQNACFTVHGDRTLIESTDIGKSCLTRIVIPASAKDRLLKDLKILGIHRSSIFPDLEGLAGELRDTRYKARRVVDDDEPPASSSATGRRDRAARIEPSLA